MGMSVGADGHQTLIDHIPHLVPSERLGAPIGAQTALSSRSACGQVEREGEPSLSEKGEGMAVDVGIAVVEGQDKHARGCGEISARRWR